MRWGLTCYIFLLGFLIMSLVLNVSAYVERGPNYETICYGSVCETDIYSYERYWFENGKWVEIDESFSDCSVDGKLRYCTNVYNFNVISDGDGRTSAFFDGKEFTVTLDSFLGRNLEFNPSVSGNVLTYKNILPEVDLVYSYLPNMLKEEIVINKPIQNLPNEDFDIGFTKVGDADFNIRESIICDARGLCQNLEHMIRENGITIKIPIDFLNNKETEYPVVIDPTIELNSSSIIWNGYITKEYGLPSTYARINNPVNYIKLGNVLTSGGTKTARGDIDWNVSLIPDGAVIHNLTLKLYATTAAVGSPNVMINITQLERDSISYPDNDTECFGNCHFWTDIHNGTVYYEDVSFITNQPVEIDLQSAIDDFEKSLSSDVFSTGLIGHFAVNKDVRIGSKDNTNSTRRPELTVVYSFVINTFNDSLVSENLSFSRNETKMKFLDIPAGANSLSAFLNLSGFSKIIYPIQVSSFQNSTSLSGAKSISVVNDIAYVATLSSDSLTIINHSDKSNPFQMSSVTGSSLDGPRGVFVLNDVAYVAASQTDSINLINVSDGYNPYIMSYFPNSSSMDTASSVYVVDNFAYVTGLDSDSLAIIDVTDPSNPYQSGAYSNSDLDNPRAVFVADGLAYVVGTTSLPGSLNIINVSDETNPTHVSTFENSTVMNGPLDLFVKDGLVYVIGGIPFFSDSFLTILDVTDPSNPSHVSTFTNQSSISSAKAVFVLDDIAYVTSNDNDSLTMVDVSDKFNPVQVEVFFNTTSLERPEDIYVDKEFSYIPASEVDAVTIIQTKSFVTNPNLEIGTPDGLFEWSWSDKFNQINERTNDLFTAINTALNNGNCDCQGCHLDSDICSVPFTFYSDTPGIVEYSDIEVLYDL